MARCASVEDLLGVNTGATEASCVMTALSKRLQGLAAGVGGRGEIPKIRKQEHH